MNARPETTREFDTFLNLYGANLEITIYNADNNTSSIAEYTMLSNISWLKWIIKVRPHLTNN